MQENSSPYLPWNNSQLDENPTADSVMEPVISY